MNLVYGIFRHKSDGTLGDGPFLCHHPMPLFGNKPLKTFTIRDLRERTGDLVRNAEAGHLFVISKHGHPLFVAVALDAHLLETGVTVALACRLFAEKALSLGKAARLAGLSAEAFIEQLGTAGIPAVDYDPAELDDEVDLLSA